MSNFAMERSKDMTREWFKDKRKVQNKELCYKSQNATENIGRGLF